MIFFTMVASISSSLSTGQARLTRPMRSASWAVMASAVKESSLALRKPTRRGSLVLIPQVGLNPHLACVSPILACSEAITRSQASMISRAPVKQKPLTRAMTGLGTERMASISSLAGISRISPTLPPVRSTSPSALRSTPAQNALPAPVSTTTLTSSALPADCTAALSSLSMKGVMAFMASGRFMVILPTPSAVW